MNLDRLRSLPLLLGVTAALGAALVPGCQDPREDEQAAQASACTPCHGDRTRKVAGSGKAADTLRAAPPVDTQGNTEASFPGVGAHQAHLTASATHAPVACGECHLVPAETGAKGHLDDLLLDGGAREGAELVFGELAKQGGRTPAYDRANYRCSDSYCHRASDAVWTAPRSSDAACGSCHGLPPKAPHPQNAKCHVCHGEVIGENGFVNAALHVDGTIQSAADKCDSCHGSDGIAAPPQDLSGNTAVSAIGVGAHRVHLAGGDVSRAVACTECHTVPKAVSDPGHNDSDLPAEVVLTGVATTDNRAPVWNRQVKRCADAWCHSPSAPAPSPEWTSEAGRLPCNGCHGTPPPSPHPQMTNCSLCHGAVVGDDDKSIKDKTRHVDGVVDVVVPTACNACHGSNTNFAPPTDVSGSSATSSPGVGAHQAHLVGSGRARKVQCAECHVVPANWDDPGHTDTGSGAELVFGGVATTGGASPSYAAGSCQKTYCHGGSFPFGAPSGGSFTAPVWTQVDGSQIGCNGCHGLPPPPPHVTSTNCSLCHKNVDSSLKIIAPDTHVDGVVTGDVP